MRVLPLLVFAGCSLAFGQAPGAAADCGADGTVVNALTGAPVPRASVSLRETVDVGSMTGADGKWAMKGVTCGPVQFTAWRAGFITGVYGSSGLISDISEEAVFLAPGSVTHGLRFLLFPESAISGTVADEFGVGLPGSVEALQLEVNGGRRELMHVGSATADSSGSYHIGGLRAGSYLVCAGAEQTTYPTEGGKPLVYSKRCYPGPPAGSATSTIAIGPGEERRIDLNLTSVATINVQGDIGGLPQDSRAPRLQLWKPTEEDPGAVQPSPNARAGTFRFSGVLPGPYWLHGRADVNGSILFASMAIQADDSDVDGIRLVFEPGASVSGAVRAEASANPPAAPLVLSGVHISLSPLGSAIVQRLNSDSKFAWEGNQGAFRISPIEHGIYRFSVDPPSPRYVKSIRLTNNSEELLGKELTVSGDTGPLGIVLSDDGGSLRGVVVDQDSKPIDASVFLFGPKPWPAIVQTGDDGTFTFRDLAPGVYRVTAFDKPGQVEYADTDWMQRNGGQGDTVTILPSRASQISLTRRTVPHP